jgi:hypothetical protein
MPDHRVAYLRNDRVTDAEFHGPSEAGSEGVSGPLSHKLKLLDGAKWLFRFLHSLPPSVRANSDGRTGARIGAIETRARFTSGEDA